MIELNDRQTADSFHRSYAAVDGLWCTKVEEKYGFDIALDIDNEVFKVKPKIQARKLKELANIGNEIEALFQCLTTKLTLEGYSYRAERIGNDGSFRIIINECPWHNTMVRSGREQLPPKVGSRICSTEYSVWASEFSDNIQFEQECRTCEGSESCTIQFRH